MSAFARGFQMGGEMYDSAERMKLAKEQQQWAREEAEAKRGEREREAAIRAAGAETLGMVDKPMEYQGGAMGPQPEDMQTGLRPDIATAPAKMYSADQAQQDYLRRLRGIDVGKAQQYEKGALELGALKRTARYADKEELALNFNNTILRDLKDAKGDISAVVEKHFIPLYNDDKLPGFKDGGKATIVPSAVGGGKSVLFTYKDGKQEVMDINLANLEQITKFTQREMMRSSSPENYWKSMQTDIQKQQADAGTTSAQAAATNAATNASELAQKIKANLFGAEANLRGAQATSALASAKQATAHAGVYENMVKLANENREAAEAIKPFLKDYSELSAEDQMGSKGQAVLVQAAAAAAKKTGDVTGIINALKKADKSQLPEVDPEAKKQAYQDLREAGTDEKAIKAVKQKWSMVFGDDETTKAIKAAIAKRESNNSGAVSPAAALPRMDQDDIPRPNTGRALPQGAYVPNARTLLNTPKYGVLGTGTFNPND